MCKTEGPTHLSSSAPPAGCRGRQDAEDWLDGGGEDRLPERGRHDEAFRPQERRQAARRVHQERARLHRHGVHALRRSQDVPPGKVGWLVVNCRTQSSPNLPTFSVSRVLAQNFPLLTLFFTTHKPTPHQDKNTVALSDFMGERTAFKNSIRLNSLPI